MNTLENTIIRLLREKPFYGHFLLNLRRETSGASPHAAGVTIRDGVPTLSINPLLFEQHTPAERQALMEHLVKHLLHLHPLRRKGRNRHDWDAACDLAINPSIDGLPDDVLRPEQFGLEPGLAAEEYYGLLAPPFDTGNLDGSGYGDGEQADQGAAGQGRAEVRDRATLDDHESWDASDSTPLALAEEVLRTITRDSLRGSDGEAPGDIRGVVADLLRPSPIPWQQVLQQFVATAGRVGATTTWMREHRRFDHITPGIRKRRRLNLLVGIDVSDSTNCVELREAFARELLAIAKGRDARITVAYANSRVQRVDAFTSAVGTVARYDGGGFTDLRPLFEYARGMHPLPAAVIYLTDGIGPAPEEMEFPTLWVLTSDGERPAPWGVELRMAAP
jgi:predicted metal-dependent peptidase